MTTIDWDMLRAEATEVAQRAYAPYSKLHVGAAGLTADGRLVRGCNVENASYGLTLCAERVAVVKAVSEGATRFTTIAIASSTKEPLMPCGACRQTLQEFAPGLRVLVAGPRGPVREARLVELLPHAFAPRDLR